MKIPGAFKFFQSNPVFDSLTPPLVAVASVAAIVFGAIVLTERAETVRSKESTWNDPLVLAFASVTGVGLSAALAAYRTLCRRP